METHIKQTDLDPDIFTLDEDTNEVSLSNDIIGLDTSSFDTKYKKQIVVKKDFTTPPDSGIVRWDIDIPSNVNMAILSIHWLDSETNRVKELMIDYQYDTINKELAFFVGKYGITGQIIIGFYEEE